MLVKDFALKILNVEDSGWRRIEDFYDPDDDNDGFLTKRNCYGSNPRDRNGGKYGS